MLFVAPTRPLVAQQIGACQSVMGIPRAEIQELTGQQPVSVRRRVWEEKRMFFATPHVVSNDMLAGHFPTHQLVCLVVDEAHKATGNYAFCKVLLNCTYTYAHSHSHSHTRNHAHTHTHPPTHTCTHTFTCICTERPRKGSDP